MGMEIMAKGNDFDQAVRTAVHDIRALEQASGFWMQFRYDLRGRLSGKKAKKRVHTPFRLDIEDVLTDRKRLIRLHEEDAPVEDLEAANRDMLARARADKQKYTRQRSQNIGMLLKKA